MARVILDHLDPEIEHLLRLRAQRAGRSLAREVESIPEQALATTGPAMTVPSLGRSAIGRHGAENDVREILALGQRLAQPFDLKSFSDALSDGAE